MKFEDAKRKIELKLTKYFKNEQGYSYDEIDDMNLFTVNLHHDVKGKFTDIEVRAELTVEEFFNVSKDLDAIVAKYDESSYFDVEEPGVYSARLYWDSVKDKKSEKSILTKANLLKLGESICLDLEDSNDETFYVDDITYNNAKQQLDIEVSSTIFEAKASMKVYDADIETYQDLVDYAKDKLVDRLNTSMKEI